MGADNSTQQYTTDKLINIENNQLVLSQLSNYDVSITKKSYVISMLGCARVGKSTFIHQFHFIYQLT
jgi:hypothetical protein